MKPKIIMILQQVLLLLMLAIPLLLRIIFGSRYSIGNFEVIKYDAICLFLLFGIAIWTFVWDTPNNYLLPIISILFLLSTLFTKRNHLSNAMMVAAGFISVFIGINLLKQKHIILRILQAVIIFVFSSIVIAFSLVGLTFPEPFKRIYYSPDRSYRAEVKINDIGYLFSDSTVDIYQCSPKARKLLFGKIEELPISTEYVDYGIDPFASAFEWVDENHFQACDITISVQ